MIFINYIISIAIIVCSFLNQDSDFQYIYSKCSGDVELSKISFIMKLDSSFQINWGSPRMPSKNQKIGIWWENDESVFIKEDGKPLKTYKKDTLLRLSVLVERNAADFWFKNKKIIQDSIFTYINENAWMYEMDTQEEKIDGMEEIEYELGIREFCGVNILLAYPRSYLISNKKIKQKKRKK